MKDGYPILGGPLDGGRAVRKDFQRAYVRHGAPTVYFRAGGWRAEDLEALAVTTVPGGKYERWGDEYVAFNRADRVGGVPSMVWLHRSMLSGGSGSRRM